MNSNNIQKSAENNYWFSKQPVFFDGYGSYYEKPLECNWALWAIIKEPTPSIYNNGKFLVQAMKIDNSLPYGSNKRITKDMILENGTLTPCDYVVWMNNHASWVTENGIMNISKKGIWDEYTLYDENFVLRDFPGLPAERYVWRIHMDDWLVTTYSRVKDDNWKDIMELKEDNSLVGLRWVPAWWRVEDIRDDVIAIVDIWDKSEQYFYNADTKSLKSFTFLPKEWYEYKSYTIDFIHPDSWYVQLIYEGGEKVTYAFNGTTSALTEQINLVSSKEYSWDRYNPQTWLLSKYDTKSVVLVIFDKEIPFSGLWEWETINADETLSAQRNTNLPFVVVEYKKKADDWFPTKECRRYNKVTWEITPIQWVDANWKVRNGLWYSKWFIGIRIKVPGFWDEVLCLLNKAWNSIIRYQWLIINWVSPASKTINISTKGGPDTSVKLSDDEREKFMKDWDSDFQSTRKQIAEAIA